MTAAVAALLALLALSVGALAALRIAAERRAAYILDVVSDARRGNGNRRLRTRSRGGLERIAGEFNSLLAEFQETLREKRRAEAAQRLMVSQVSHDLRTPLTSILGYVDALSTDGSLSAEERAEFLRIVKDKCLFLNSLIDDFFALSLLDQEEAAAAPGAAQAHGAPAAAPCGAPPSCDLCAVAEDVLLSFHRDLTQRSIEPEIRLPDRPLFVRAARKDMERVLMNLVSNTVRHGRGARRIGFTVEQAGGGAVCLLSDDGCGVPEEELPFLFDNPYAAERLPPAGGSARGLGLFIVRRLLEKAGGSIEASASPSGGVSFRFTVPLL